MEKVYLNDLPSRIDEALKNKMPEESKLIFVGEIQAAYYSGLIPLNEFDGLLLSLGFKREELFKYTDYVSFGKLQED